MLDFKQDQQMRAELLELIDQQRLDDESYEKGVEEAFNDQIVVTFKDKLK